MLHVYVFLLKFDVCTFGVKKAQVDLLCTKMTEMLQSGCCKALGLGQALHSFFWWGDRRDKVELLWYLGFDQIQRIRSESSPDQRRSLDNPSLEASKGASEGGFLSQGLI